MTATINIMDDRIKNQDLRLMDKDLLLSLLREKIERLESEIIELKLKEYIKKKLNSERSNSYMRIIN